MYNEKIEALIKAALADGLLTEKEKQVLFKKAQEQGIDLDEFEMVLDARLVELQKVEKSAPKSNKFGDVRKCPACGAIVASGSAVCLECGYAFNEDGSTTAMNNLYERLEAIDKQSGTKREKAGKKMQAIRTFNVPNTRAELLGLLSTIPQLANPRGPKDGIADDSSEDLSLAYWNLFCSCINKAKISFAKDSNFISYFEQYDNMLAKSKKFRLGIGGKLGLGIFALLFLLIALIKFNPTPEQKFAKSIENGDIEGARAAFIEMGTDNYLESYELIKLYVAKGDVDGAIDVYENLTPSCPYSRINNLDYNSDAKKLIRSGLLKAGRYYEMWEYYESHVCSSYFSFMEEVVIYLCKENKKEEARTFIEDYIGWFENNIDPSDYYYKEYNSTKVKSKLNQIINSH